MMDSQHPLYYQCQFNSNEERFGLCNSSNNFFYILDNNYQRLKFIQLLLIDYYQLPVVSIDAPYNLEVKVKNILKENNQHLSIEDYNRYVKKLKNSNNELYKALDNSNSYQFGLEKTNLRFEDYEVTPENVINNIIKHTDTVSVDTSTREKMFFLRYVLFHIDTSIEFYTAMLIEESRTHQLKAKSYGEFFKLCYPLDSKVQQITQDEIAYHKEFEQEIKNYKSTLIQLLNKLDYNQSTKELILMLDRLLLKEYHNIFESFSTSYRSKTTEVLKTSFSKQLLLLLKFYE
jgi:hypothetical protein